VIEIMQQ